MSKSVTLSSGAKKAIRKLADSLFMSTSGNDRDPYDDDGMWRPIPAHLRRPDAPDRETEPGTPMLGLTGEDAALFSACLDILEDEPLLEHITRQDIDTMLWALVCELWGERDRFRNQGLRKAHIDAFIAAAIRPHERYEVLFVINAFAIEADSLSIADVAFHHLTEERATEWGLVTSSGMQVIDRSEFIERLVARVEVRAGSAKTALDRARRRVDTALDILRVGVASIQLIHQGNLLFRRGTIYAMKRRTDASSLFTSWERHLAPQTFTLGGDIFAHVRAETERLAPAIDGTIPGRLGEQVARAIHLTARSRTREDNDDAVLDLTTALETLLTTRSDPRKGEAIAMRTMLLGSEERGGFLHPVKVYDLYERRSRISHGSERGESTERERNDLYIITRRVLGQVLQLLKSDPKITQPIGLIQHLQTPESLDLTIDWLRGEQYEAGDAIRKCAEKELSRLTVLES